MIHDRVYRPVTDAEMDSAARGLKLNRVSDAALVKMLKAHKQINMFASAVVCKAIIREMADRCLTDYLEEISDADA